MTNSLVTIQCLLPPTIQLHPNLDASEDHLLSSSEVNAKLNDISIIDRPRSRFYIWLAESDVVEKRSGRAFNVSDIPLAV